MNIKNKVIFFLCYIVLSFSSLGAKDDFRLEDQPNALEQAHSIKSCGVLKQKENGFVYLDVSNEFVTSILPLLEHEGRLSPRPTSSKSIGAHISVFYEKEEIVPKELGEVFSFKVKEIRTFTLSSRDGLKKLWVIAVDSPELGQLRESYGLSPKLKGYDYHISLAKQLPSEYQDESFCEGVSSYDLSDEPTSGLYTKGDFVTVSNDAVLHTAQKIDAIGQLKLKNNGFVYLDVDDRFVTSICDYLPTKGSFKPLSTGSKKMGAHISTIHEDEMIGHGIWTFEEAGNYFSFEVKQLRYVDRKTSKGAHRLWLLAVDAPGLERLRTHYGLKPKFQNHDFHITLGYESISQDDSDQEMEYAEAA